MKKNNRKGIALLSGLLLGILGGFLLAPSKGKSLRSTLLFRIKKYGNKFSDFILKVFGPSKFKLINEAKETGNEVIRTTRTKAKKLLEDIKKITDKQ